MGRSQRKAEYKAVWFADVTVRLHHKRTLREAIFKNAKSSLHSVIVLALG